MNYKQYVIYRDSLYNEESTKKTVQAKMQFEFDKREAENRVQQEKKDTLAAEEKEKQVIIRNSLVAGFILVLLLAGAIFRGYRSKQRANLIITLQKQEVERAKAIIEDQKRVVEEKQNEILASIHYAKRIQDAFIPPEKHINKALQKLR